MCSWPRVQATLTPRLVYGMFCSPIKERAGPNRCPTAAPWCANAVLCWYGRSSPCDLIDAVNAARLNGVHQRPHERVSGDMRYYRS